MWIIVRVQSPGNKDKKGRGHKVLAVHLCSQLSIMESLDFVFQDVVDQTEPCFQFTTLHLAGCLFSVFSSSGTLPFKTHPFHMNCLIFTICLPLFDGPPSTPSHPQVSRSIPLSLPSPPAHFFPLPLRAHGSDVLTAWTPLLLVSFILISRHLVEMSTTL